MSCSISLSKKDLFDDLSINTDIPYKFYYRGRYLESYESDIDSLRYALVSYSDYVNLYLDDSYFAPSEYDDKVSVIKKNGNGLDSDYIDIVYTGDCFLDSNDYSDDCPFRYVLYSEYDSTYNVTHYYLDIYKSDVIVDHQLLKEIYYNDDYAIDYMQTYIDDCIAHLKIETDCCVLVCCEPDKYKMIGS